MRKQFVVFGQPVEFTEVTAIWHEDPDQERRHALFVHTIADVHGEGDGIIFEAKMPESDYDAETMIINEYLETYQETLETVKSPIRMTNLEQILRIIRTEDTVMIEEINSQKSETKDAENAASALFMNDIRSRLRTAYNRVRITYVYTERRSCAISLMKHAIAYNAAEKDSYRRMQMKQVSRKSATLEANITLDETAGITQIDLDGVRYRYLSSTGSFVAYAYDSLISFSERGVEVRYYG